MRTMKAVLSTLIALSIFCSPLLPAVLASAEEADLPHLSLSDFLREMDMTFDEYVAFMAEVEETGAFPHELGKNASRYDAFQRANPGIARSAAIAYVNVNVDLGPYKDIQEVPEQEMDSATVLVNKNFALPASRGSGDMIDIGYGFMVHEEAAEPLVQMREAMREKGLRFNLMCTFRSYSSSAGLHTNAVNQWGWAIADLNWARGGHSEHQTGLSADILQRTDTPSLTEARFESSEEYAWLKENAHDYGFILRYPAEYEEITGYKFEPWHWRYVGADIAAAMRSEGIAVYEEFYGKYLASDVLYNVKALILEQRTLAEAEEVERLEREAAERQAQEDAAREAEEAAREAEEAALAAAAEAERLAAQLAEEERLAAQLEQEEAEAEAQREARFVLVVSMCLTAAICCTVAAMYVKIKRNERRARADASAGVQKKKGRRK